VGDHDWGPCSKKNPGASGPRGRAAPTPPTAAAGTRRMAGWRGPDAAFLLAPHLACPKEQGKWEERVYEEGENKKNIDH